MINKQFAVLIPLNGSVRAAKIRELNCVRLKHAHGISKPLKKKKKTPDEFKLVASGGSQVRCLS